MTGVLRQSMRFGAVGLVNTALGLGAIYAVMYFFNAGPAVANAIGYAIGLSASFMLNRAWTFSDRRPSADLLPRFLLVVAAAYLLNLAVVVVATMRFSANPYLAQVFGVGVYTVFMFLGCRGFVFSSERAV